MEQAFAFKQLYETIVRLRAPDGCPWDREQNPQTLRSDLIEETFECVEAIDEHDPAHIREELGDLFLLVTMIAYMHEQEGIFSVEEVLNGIREKLIRRHPHVFGTMSVKDSAEVLKNWAQNKVQQEGRAPKDSWTDTVPRGIPPLERAFKLQKKAADMGFDGQNVNSLCETIAKELNTVQHAPQHTVEEELGKLLFTVVNLCRVLSVDPTVALQKANVTFVNRCTAVEKKALKEQQPCIKILKEQQEAQQYGDDP
ncbi:MAG: nucleoside triphosphate pyrophosphohydrolase [Treponema sp.]|jgi:tetrapyrrole methylase family protein/MazG family protein|nr:nucleoside triphosphate pyrophosphohydrolase [Treponema sp.]